MRNACWRGLLMAFALFWAGCGGASSRDDNGCETLGGAAGAAGIIANAVQPPAECTAPGHNPFVDENCGEALKTLCRGQPTEQACAAQGPFDLDGNYWLCGWAKVVKFSDPDTCTVASVQGRCEAGIMPLMGCVDPCDDTDGMGLYDALESIATESELVEMPCVLGDVLGGPVGKWTAIANQQGDELYAASCGAGLPPPPSICNCHKVACDAE